ncbi:Bax inhibitor-1/YccA family protein [Novosphingobium sp.]|uniref:Bax inhibitor-1/YccA family protein n=1 Tax=Novosphingobium sp. TaxID=1874826 RepID=UPI00333EDCF8
MDRNALGGRNFSHARPAPVNDAGLRRHMLGIYRNMGIALIISGVVAYGISATPALSGLIFGTPLKWVAMLAPLAFVFLFSFRFERMSLPGAIAALGAFAAIMGVSMASVFLVFTSASIATTFFIAASVFLAMSLWGYTTGVDLSRWSSFLMMGVVGLVIAGLVNLFLQSGPLQLVISIIGVAVFTGLAAWDTQRARTDYMALGGGVAAEKLAVMSAFSLYLNFVNLFQLMLQFTGVQRD